MNLLLTARQIFGRLPDPSRHINRWLLSHWPMIWAERYHVALVAAGIISVAAILLGFTQGATVSYVLPEPLDVPLERGLWAAPWCIAGVWFWIRAKGYDSLPIARIRHGLLYGFFDLLVIFVLVLIPFHYSWSYQLGLQTHLTELENTAEDEFKLAVAWNEWQRLLLLGFPDGAIEDASKRLDPKRHPFRGFNDFSWDKNLSNRFPGIATWSVLGTDDLARIGITASNLKDAISANDPSFVAERAKLEAVLRPLSQKYIAIDLSRYLNSPPRLTVDDIAKLMIDVNLENAAAAFNSFHTRVSRFIDYGKVGVIQPEMWILFGTLLTMLAIPATTARMYWTAWGVLTTGTVVGIFLTVQLPGVLGARATMVLAFGFPTLLVAALLLALTNRKIGKHNWIKVVSVFVPLGLAALPWLIPDSLSLALPYRLSAALGASVISRLMFNRLRSLPDPF